MEPALKQAQDQPVAILCVDDEVNILAALRRLFKPLDYQVLTATGGAEGLELMDEHPVDVVVSDMRMPQMDGAAFLEQAAARWPDTARILLTGHADIEAAIGAINKGRIYRYLSKPWQEADLTLTVQSAVAQRRSEQERRRLEQLTIRQNEELHALNTELEARVASRTAELAQAHESLRTNYVLTVKGFSNLIEAREPMLAGHSRRVADLGKALAQQMGMDARQVQDISHAALLHDIGKIGLPDHLLTRPYESLSPAERERVRAHPVTAQGIMVGLDTLQEVGWTIRNHHEHFDGSGYPDGRRGEDIPLGARILAVVNDYDAVQIGTLTATRLSETRARQYLRERAGGEYDPTVVQQFFALLDAREEQDEVRRSIVGEELRPGMVLARDLVGQDGILLLTKGYVLDDTMILKIRTFEGLTGCRLEIAIADA